MTIKDSHISFRKNIKQQKEKAIAWLDSFKKDKIVLKRPLFFIPGWQDKNCASWTQNRWWKKSAKNWLEEFVINCSDIHYITFDRETEGHENFIDFSNSLKKKIWNAIGKDKPFDMIGYSTGGLNVRAAITQNDPLLNCEKCITVATPHRVENLHPDYPLIKAINEPLNRQLFLERVGAFYQIKKAISSREKKSAVMDPTGIESLYEKKAEHLTLEGTDRTGKTGITHDPRTISAIIKFILNIKH